MTKFWDSILHFLRSLLGNQPVQNSLARLSPEEIRRERIRIEQTELKLTREIDGLERQKDELFHKGVEGGSERQRLQIARKIKELDGLVQVRDRQLKLITQNLRVLNGVAGIKENDRLLKDLGMEALVGKMDLSELQTYIEQSTIEGQFQMERYTKLKSSLDEADSTFQIADEDPDTLKILNAMQTASAHKTEAVIDAAVEASVEPVTPIVRQPAMVEG